MDVLGEKNPFTQLVIDLDGVDPDDAFSKIPYEKGSAFLWYLEEKVGGPGLNVIVFIIGSAITDNDDFICSQDGTVLEVLLRPLQVPVD